MIKNSISKIYNDIRQSGYAPPVWKRAQVPGLKESRLTIRGDEDRGLVKVTIKRSAEGCTNSKSGKHGKFGDTGFSNLKDADSIWVGTRCPSRKLTSPIGMLQ